jgi:hypothetical protein
MDGGCKQFGEVTVGVFFGSVRGPEKRLFDIKKN